MPIRDVLPKESKIEKTSLASVMDVVGGVAAAAAVTAAAGKVSFHQAPLLYAEMALEPVISREVLRLHCERHQTFIDALNAEKIAPGTTLESLFARSNKLSKGVRFNGGAHWNYSFFWATLTDQKEDQEIAPELQKAIESEWKTLEDFKSAFVREGGIGPAEGWLWLLKTPNGRLRLVATVPHDNPLMTAEGDELSGWPLLTCPLWTPGTERDEFLRRFFAIANWVKADAAFSTSGPVSEIPLQ